MLIVTPLLIGQTLHPKVVSSVGRLNSFWLIVSEDAHYQGYERELSINHTRAMLHRQACNILDDHKYVLLLDSDVVIDDPSIIEEMKTKLDNGFIAACIKTKESDHILSACALVKSDFYRIHLGPSTTPNICQCRRIARLGEMCYVGSSNAYEVGR